MKARFTRCFGAWKRQGLLVSEWREENKRNKRFYRLSPDGETILRQLLDEWQGINSSISRIVQGE